MVQSLDSDGIGGNLTHGNPTASRLSFVWGPDIGSQGLEIARSLLTENELVRSKGANDFVLLRDLYGCLRRRPARRSCALSAHHVNDRRQDA